MKIPVAALTALLACAAPPSPAAPAKFDGARAFEDLRQIVALGPRPAGSPALQKTRDYLKNALTAAGLKVEEQPFDAQTPLGTIHMVNIRATLPGAATALEAGPATAFAAGRTEDRGRIVIGGHYDTKLAPDFRFVGASD